MEEIRTQVILCISSMVLKLLFLKTSTRQLGNIAIKSLHEPQKETLISCTEVFQMCNDRQEHLKTSLRSDKDVWVCEKNKNKYKMNFRDASIEEHGKTVKTTSLLRLSPLLKNGQTEAAGDKQNLSQGKDKVGTH